MRIDVIVAAYALPAELEQLMESTASTPHDMRWHVFLHSRTEAVTAAVETLASRFALHCYPFGFNRGLSRAWNQGMIRAFAEGADVVLLVNDDITFGAHAADRLVDYAYEHRETHYAVSCHGYDHRAQKRKYLGYSCIALNPLCMKVVGCFDENLGPAYYEDCDYARRAILAGAKLGVIRNLDVSHLGSATLGRVDEVTQAGIWRAMELSRAYYFRKWGGDADHEIFLHPFSRPQFGNTIPPRWRQAPYGAGFDRTDWVTF